MLDRPHGPELLDAIADLLRNTLIPQLPAAAVFQARVAVNAVELVAREMRLGPAADAGHRQRLQVLMNTSADPGALPEALVRQLRDGDMDADTPGLLDHLWLSTLEKLAIDQPNYASYRRALEWRQAGPVASPLPPSPQ